MAVFIPIVKGLNVITKIVELPAATVELGGVVIEKSAAFAPEKDMAPIVKGTTPVFCMVKV
jgi:hypothetical protein